MGAQQAIGTILVELFAASFEEIRSAFSSGMEGESLYDDIRIRFNRVRDRLVRKWKDASISFGEGFISGFLSNLITTIANTFVTTAKRTVRLIREGVMSLLRALRTIIFPRQGMTYREAAHEGIKLIFSGGIVVAGVALEEIIEKMFASVPIFTPFAQMASVITISSISAIAMAVCCYILDKLDFFGAIRVEKDNFVIGRLSNEINEHKSSCISLLDKIDEYCLPG